MAEPDKKLMIDVSADFSNNLNLKAGRNIAFRFRLRFKVSKFAIIFILGAMNNIFRIVLTLFSTQSAIFLQPCSQNAYPVDSASACFMR